MIKILNDKRILISVIVLQTLTLLAVYISWEPRAGNRQTTRVLAETIQDPDEDYRNCLAKPVAERETCAREIGLLLANDTTISASDKFKNCMKLRPVFYRFCLEELRQFP